ncbi:MAG TPA: metallophosphoesterase [Sphingomicrobium sp.]|nr:metallophosphoesterase [Sphingomicrobium sp.]
MNRLVKFWSQSEGSQRPRAPSGVRLYAVGDIHGHGALLEQMLAAIEQDIAQARPADNVLVFLGDLIDRGPSSAAVLERLRTLAGPFKSVFLTGNHEEVLIRILEGDDELVGDWLRFGGLECAQSYGLEPERLRAIGAAGAGEAVREAIPEAHQQFLRSFADSFGAGDYLFVHAGIRPGVPLEQQSLTDLRWIRSPFLEYRHHHPKVVVHGHSISKDIDRRPGRIGVDTGAYRTGLLSAIVLDGAEQRVIQVGNRR